MGRRPEAREKILESASRMFWRFGYEGVGVDAICAEAQVNKGSLYHHHRDKEDLAVAVIARNIERTQDAMQHALSGKVGRARILGYLDWMIAVQTENARVAGAFCGCPLGKMAVGQAGSPIGKATGRALDLIADFVAAALGELPLPPASRRRRAVAEEFVMLWQGALVLSEANNSVLPLTRVRRLTARRIAELEAG